MFFFFFTFGILPITLIPMWKNVLELTPLQGIERDVKQVYSFVALSLRILNYCVIIRGYQLLPWENMAAYIYLKARSPWVKSWDEASIASANVLMVMQRLLKDLMQTNISFGGKVILLGGDFT